MTRQCVFIFALLAASCGSAPTPEGKARRDAADVALVEAAQDRRPPTERITPEAITTVDKELHSLAGAACSFFPYTAPQALPILVAFPEKAMIKIEGKMLVFAGDSASAELTHGVRTAYDGRAYALSVTKGKQGQPAFLTITDSFERPVFSTAGALDCEDQASAVTVLAPR